MSEYELRHYYTTKFQENNFVSKMFSHRKFLVKSHSGRTVKFKSSWCELEPGRHSCTLSRTLCFVKVKPSIIGLYYKADYVWLFLMLF